MENKLLFLGTGASDWLIEKRLPGMYFRRYTSALLNDDLLIDCGPHIFDYLEKNECPALLKNLETVIITHRHSDHIDPSVLMKIAERKEINLICDDYTYSLVKDAKNIKQIKLPLYKKTRVGKYQIIALPANHDVHGGGKDARHFIIITPDGKELYYGLDGTWFTTSEWIILKKHQCDVMVFDCTIGRAKDARVFEHNNFSMVKQMAKQVRREKVLKKGGKIVASHFSRKLMPSHPNTKLMLKLHGIIAAYDGFEIKF